MTHVELEKLLIIAIKQLGGSIVVSPEEFESTKLQGTLTQINNSSDNTITFVYDEFRVGK